jgi:hypothetical protein
MNHSLNKTLLCLALLFAWTSAHAFSPIVRQFGTDFDGDGGFSFAGVTEVGNLNAASEWSVTNDGIRYFRDNSSVGSMSEYVDAAALFQVSGLGNGTFQNFQVTLAGEIKNLGADWNRFGIIALSDGNAGQVDYYNETGHYNGRFHRLTSGSDRSLRISQGVGNHLGGSGQLNLPAGMDTGKFILTLTGTYNESNQLLLELDLWHENHPDDTFTLYTGLQSGDGLRDGDYFGFGGRFRASSASETEILFTSISIVPEPRFYGLFAGVLVLMGVMLRRRV